LVWDKWIIPECCILWTSVLKRESISGELFRKQIANSLQKKPPADCGGLFYKLLFILIT
jgi:hypothetical protein